MLEIYTSSNEIKGKNLELKAYCLLLLRRTRGFSDLKTVGCVAFIDSHWLVQFFLNKIVEKCGPLDVTHPNAETSCALQEYEAIHFCLIYSPERFSKWDFDPQREIQLFNCKQWQGINPKKKKDKTKKFVIKAQWL